MKITNPILQYSGKKIKVRAFLQSNRNKKEELYVTLDKQFEDFLAADATPFASLMLLPCARYGEDIELVGSVSRRWHLDSQKIVQRVATWGIGIKPMSVFAELKPDTYNPQYTGVFFSGGVDSFASYLKFKNSKDIKITHFIFVHGFDIEIENTKLYKEVLRNVRTIARKEGITCINLQTNLRKITDYWLNWDMAHGGALAMIALLLRKKFKTIIFPGNGNAAVEEPWGTSSHMDHWWSTETLSIVHDLDHRTRLQKVQDYIAHSELAKNYLRVCWRNREYNCGVCDKCLCTMVELQIAGILGQVKTFPDALDLNRIKQLYSTPYTVQGYLEEAVTELKKSRKDPLLLQALEQSLRISTHPDWKRRLIKYIHDLDDKYNENRLYLFLSRRNWI